MKEKLAGCLGYGRLALLLVRSKGRAAHGQRYLHSAFWSHGAALIDLPAWWILLLQSSGVNDNIRSEQSKGSAALGIVSQLHSIFLGFLYPVQTLALIRKLRYSTNAHLRAAHNVKRCSRNYASIATSLISNSQASAPKPAQDLRHFVSNRHKGKRDDLARSIGQPAEAKLRSLPCHKTWQLYQDVVQDGGFLSPSETINFIKYLSASTSHVDFERILALFEAIPMKGRRAVHYSYAISASLRLQDTETALYVHREAKRRLRCPLGASALLHRAVAFGNWTLAMEVWRPFWVSGFALYTLRGLWRGVEAMPFDFLMDKVSSFADVFLASGTSHKQDDILSGRAFVTEMVIHMLQVRLREDSKSKFNIQRWHTLMLKVVEIAGANDKSQVALLQELAVHVALSLGESGYDLAALEIYHDVRRKVPGLNVSKELLTTLLRTSRLCNAVSGAVEILREWRRIHGKVDKFIYRSVMRTFANKGKVQELEIACSLYGLDHGEIVDPRIWQHLLRVHYWRADPQQVTKAFTSIQGKPEYIADVRLFNTVISTFARVGDVEGVTTWLENLERASLKPNLVTYFALLWVHGKRGDRDAVNHMLERALSDGLKPDRSMIELVVYVNVTDQKFDEAERLLEEALTMGLGGSLVRMWNIFLAALAFRRDLRKVQQIHNRMKEVGIQSNVQTYGAILTSLCVMKAPRAAYRILRKIMPEAGFKPQVSNYVTVMMGFVKIRDYDKSFEVYRHMLMQGLAPNMSSESALLRTYIGSGRHPQRNRAPKGYRSQVRRARQVLQRTIDNLDRSQLVTSEPWQFVGPERLDEAFTSSNFDYMVYIYGTSKMYKRVSETFQTYIATAAKFKAEDVEISPPMRMVSALLVAHERSGNTQEVERCWCLALDKCEKLARKSLIRDPFQTKWVLPARRFVINFPFRFYLRFLARQKRFEDMIGVVDELCEDGYDLSADNWNAYVQHLSCSPNLTHQLLAFTVCETRLMSPWLGWDYMGRHRGNIMDHFNGMRNVTVRTRIPAPTYLTFVYLAKVYRILGFGRATRKQEGVWDLQQSGAILKTLNAVSNLPKMDDEEQRSILRIDDQHLP
ncbi:uncharacterized protein KY384_008672 [Bacidia gigantensis]|uniref:uncharacterized protein n=1 Tax=Bacidia gigantensis TaxID=2732470 RepID=UPI001D04634B|nr:uncharacterized protein KY384_008672 [Bacidia gigantensis]KAG8526472.1 hypothetical protein KY384_008672 [Bacidia gigantensis]